MPEPWQSGASVYKGVVNMATGNLTLQHGISSWRTLGPGVSFGVIYNSQDTASSDLGPKWRHSYAWSVSGTNPAIVTHPDGHQLSYALVSGNYVSPAGHYENLVKLSGGNWTLTNKAGTVFEFSSAGKVTGITDANGNQTTLSYTSGVLTTVTDPVGRALTLAYTSGKVSSVTDPESRVWSLTYDGSGRLYRVTDPTIASTSYYTEFGYNSNNCVTTVKNRLGKQWSYSYGTNNVFTGQTNPLGKSIAVTPQLIPYPNELGGGGRGPSASGRAASVAMRFSDELSDVSVHAMNSDGTMDYFVDPNGKTTGFTRDSNQNGTQVTLPDSATISNTYDSSGNVLTTTDPTSKVTTRTYNSNNNLLTVVEPGGYTTTHTYNSYRNRLTTTDPTGNVTSSSYNTNGTVAITTDAASKTWTFGYDSYGNQTSVTDPLSNVSSATYSYDRVASRTDARSRTTNYSYDAWGRPSGIDYPTSTDQSFTYDAESRLTQAVDGTGTRTYGYDDVGRRTSQTDPRGTTNATYDDAGRLSTQTDVSGRAISYGYDAAGRGTTVGDSTSSTTTTYDDRNRISTVTYSNGVKSTYTYDSAGRVASLNHKKTSTNTTLLEYTASYDSTSKRLSSVVEGPTSATTSYTFDSSGRLLTENRTGGSPYASTYTYNSRGLRATGFRSESSTTSHDGTYTYDSAGRLTTVTQPSLATENYTWNADGTLASLPGSGYTRNLSYDEEGRLIELKQGTTSKFTFGYGYDGGRRWTKDLAKSVWSWFPCGVACSAGELTELTSDLTGATWTTASSSLTRPGCGGGGLPLRIGAQVPLPGLFGQTAAVTDSSATVVATAVFDAFGVQRFGTGTLSAGVLRATYGNGNEDGMSAFLNGRAQRFGPQDGGLYQRCKDQYEFRVKNLDAYLASGIAGCTALGAGMLVGCGFLCAFPATAAACVTCLLAATDITLACLLKIRTTYKKEMQHAWDEFVWCQGKGQGKK